MTDNASCNDLSFCGGEYSNNDLHEELDSTGETVRVGNLKFVEGILGKGAYGTVRLAARENVAGLPLRTHSRRELRSHRRLGRSSSAPAGKDIFGSYHNEPYRREHTERVSFLLEDENKKTRTRSFDLSDESSEDEGLVAVKIFRKSLLKRMRTMERNKETNRMQVKTALEKVEREIALMKKLSHPNLVKFFEAIDSPDSGLLYMVIEYMPLGEILTYQNNGTFRRKAPKAGSTAIPGLSNGHFDECHAALYFVDILHGLAYLHQHHIVHRDLKPGKPLLYASGS